MWRTLNLDARAVVSIANPQRLKNAKSAQGNDGQALSVNRKFHGTSCNPLGTCFNQILFSPKKPRFIPKFSKLNSSNQEVPYKKPHRRIRLLWVQTKPPGVCVNSGAHHNPVVTEHDECEPQFAGLAFLAIRDSNSTSRANHPTVHAEAR
jgi:hypothetical protein